MRSIWKGSIAFGLVNVPIKVYAATETHDVSLHQVHDEDKGRIRYKRVCEFGHDVDYADIQRAYDDGDKTVVLTADDFKQLPSEQSHEIEVLEFVPTEQIDPMILEKSYYLEPDSRSPKAYVLLRKTLEQTDRTAVVQFTLRQKTRLGVLRVHDDVLLLQGLLWGDEVRAADFGTLDTSVKVSANELKMSSSLVESMSTDFDPDKFTDEYQVQLQQLIDAKLESGDDVDTDATFGSSDDDEDDEGGDVIDLMAALRASVDKKRGGGSGSGSGSSTGSRSGGSSRTAAKTSGGSSGSSGTASRSSSTAKRSGSGTSSGGSRSAKSASAKSASAKSTSSKSTSSKSTSAKSTSSTSAASGKGAAAKAPAKKAQAKKRAS